MIPRAQFGSTGHLSSRVLFGAATLGAMSQERADATLALVADAGINHIDTAAGYGNSEERLRPWLATHRADVFLATKTGDRTASQARASLERSLTRMGVDSVDLIQLHNLVEADEWDIAHAPGGVLEALVQARDEGLCRFIGVTGHGTRIPGRHLASLQRFDYDAVLFPVNAALMFDSAYAYDVRALLDACAERGVAVQTIKAIARGRWGADQDGSRFSWYEPLSDVDAIGRAVRYVLANEQMFLNSTSDARLLPLVFAAASGQLAPPTDSDMAHDIETFGITRLFDGADLERI